MSSLPITSDESLGTTQPVQGMNRPDAISAELDHLIFQVEDEGLFQQALLQLVVQVTGSRAALLYHAEDNRLQPKVVISPEGGTFTSQQQMDIVAYNSVQKGTAQRATITQADGKLTLLCVPFLDPEEMPMALAILLGPERAPYLEPAFALLQLVPQAFGRRHSLGSQRFMHEGFAQSTLLVDLFSKVARAKEFRQSISTICEEMRELIGSYQVAIGLGNQRRCRVYGLSGRGKLEKRSHATSLLAAAMRETMGVNCPVTWPERQDLAPALTSVSQAALLEATGAREMLSIPITVEHEKSGDKPEVIGACTLLFDDEHPLTAHDLELMDAASPHLGALIHLSSRSLPRGLQGAWKRFWGGASQVKKTVFVAAPILFAGVMLLPLPYRIAADCRLQPKQSRQIAAPFDGILEESFVKPGMRVGEGDLLAVLDGKEIHWRLANAKARREAAMKERDQALPKGDVGAMQLAQLEADGLALEVELLEYKKENLEIRAPIEGTVLSGNLERSKGVPVSTGQKLFDLAPIDTFEVEIHVPDSEVNSVEVGQKVQFRLESQARFRFESTLSEVYPISEVHDDRNVFVCLSTIDGKGEVLRPGMRGKARIVTPARPLGWIIFHRLWDSIRLRFW